MYRRTREEIDGHPCFASAAGKHLFRHPETDEWQLHRKRFDPSTSDCWACIPAAGGPVPTGARAWDVADGAELVPTELTALEVDAAAAAAVEAECAAAAAAGLAAAVAQGAGVVRGPSAR